MSIVRPNLGAALAALLLLAGCGETQRAALHATARKAAHAPPAAKPSVYPDDPQMLARATSPKQKHDLVVLWRDTRALRAVVARTPGSSLKGTPAVRRATSAFLDELDRAGIDNLSKNRAIDHAASAVSAVCEQCFQQLEAVRPIPAIAH